LSAGGGDDEVRRRKGEKMKEKLKVKIAVLSLRSV
jgi:hypothetical protein